MEQAESFNAVAWILNNKITNERGTPMEFKDHAFMIDPYLDRSERQVTEKCSQIGYSVMAILRSFHLARYAGANIIHTFPSRSMSKDFVVPKVNPLIKKNSVVKKMLGTDTQNLKGIGDRFIYYRGCFSENTELLTVDGWKKHGEVKKGELMPTINQETEEVELKPINKIFLYDVDEELVHIKNRSIDCLVTKDHNLLVRKSFDGRLQTEKAKDVKGFSNWRIPLIGKEYVGGKGIPESEAFCKILGWVVGDGSYWKRKHPKRVSTMVAIIQKNKRELLEEDLKRAEIPYSVQVRGDGVARYKLRVEHSKRIVDFIPKKTLPLSLVYEMSHKQRRALFDGLMASDGHKDGTKFTQTKKETVENFRILCILLGTQTGIHKRKTDTVVYLKTSRNCFKFEVNRVPYKGKVWCVENDNHTVFARRNGRIFGSSNSYEQTEAVSISADILMQDEYDRSDQKVLRTYRSRLDDAKRENPELGWEWQFSNPSIPGYGVDELFQKSDRKHWMVKCKYCNKWQFLTFKDNIDKKNRVRVCSKCKRKINKEVLRGGQWVKMNRRSKVSGYWISQMMVPWITAEKIIEDSKGDQEVFHNFTLGLPYVSKDVVVRRGDIIKCLNPGYNPKNNVAMGVDNGVTKHYVIGNRFGIFRIGETKDWDKIVELRNFYKAHMVIDALPYPTIPRQLAEKYQGKVYIHYYRQDQKSLGVVKWDMDGYVAQSDRTKMIDSVVSDIHSQDIMFNMTATDLDEYITHWENMFRIIEETPQGIQKPKWKTIEGKDDHYAHATIYWRVALEQTMSTGDIVDVEGARRSESDEEHPFIYSNHSMTALDLQDVLNRVEAKKWKVKRM